MWSYWGEKQLYILISSLTDLDEEVQYPWVRGQFVNEL